MTDLFMGDDAYHDGAFMLAANFSFYTAFKPRPQPTLPARRRAAVRLRHQRRLRLLSAACEPLRSATGQFFQEGHWLWEDQIRHDTYDAYWQARDLSRHMSNITCAVLVVGGWFDAEDLAGPLQTFKRDRARTIRRRRSRSSRVRGCMVAGDASMASGWGV